MLSHLEDNPIQRPDTVNNWGNHVIILDHRGFFVELSHFSRSSIRVKEGDRVERGSLLGLCGNSGYSRQPHIHLQVQLTAIVGAYTAPFCFTGFAGNNRYHACDLPAKGAVVEPLYWNQRVERSLIPPLDEVYTYSVKKGDKIIDTLKLTVKMAWDGTHYYDSGRGKLYFGSRDGTFYFYGIEGDDPYLETMLQALPSFPLACRKDLEWDAQLPRAAFHSGWRKALFQWLASFSYTFARARGKLICLQPNKISGTLSSTFPALKRDIEVCWDEDAGFSTFKSGSFQLCRFH